jgi:hypothetical protein
MPMELHLDERARRAPVVAAEQDVDAPFSALMTAIFISLGILNVFS